MKLLAIGDFHGTFPKKFERIISKEKIDVVVSNGEIYKIAFLDKYMISDKQKEAIRTEAREILEKFARSLEKVKVKEVSRSLPKDEGKREEQVGLAGDADFRTRMFDNAPKKSGNCIVAEKGNW